MSRRKLAKEVDWLVELWCSTPFVWGEQGEAADCFISLGNMIRRAHGYDPVEEYRGRYKSMIGAVRVTKEFGGFSGALIRCGNQFSWKRIDPQDAHIGDIGLVASEKGLRCGVVKHRRMWLSQHVKGYGINGYPNDEVFMAWKIV